jgi:hypothetical protein
MALQESEKLALRRHAHVNMSPTEEEKLGVGYLMLKRMTGVADTDEKTLDILQIAAPIFAFAPPGQMKMASLYLRWKAIEKEPVDSSNRKQLKTVILNLCSQVECLRTGELSVESE